MARKMLLSLIALMIWVSVSACGSKNIEQEALTPTKEAVPTTQPLTIFGPNGAKQILTTFEPIIALSGLPYDVRIVEGISC